MPYADPHLQKAAQRRWYERKRDAEARGDEPPAKLEPVAVPESLRGCHAIIRQMRENHASMRRYDRHMQRMLSMPYGGRWREEERQKAGTRHPHSGAPMLAVERDMLDRVLLIAHGIVRAATSRGHTVAPWTASEAPRGLPLAIEDEIVVICFKQVQRQRKVEVPSDERWLNGSHRTELYRIDELEISVGAKRIRDTKRWRVEDRLAQLLDAVEETAAEAQDLRRRQRERAEREAELQRVERERRAACELERARLDALLALVARDDKAATNRRALAILRERPDDEARRWMEWGERHLAMIDPRLAPIPSLDDPNVLVGGFPAANVSSGRTTNQRLHTGHGGPGVDPQ